MDPVEDPPRLLLGEDLLRDAEKPDDPTELPDGIRAAHDVDLQKSARSSPAGRRLRALRRILMESEFADTVDVVERCRRAGRHPRATGLDDRVLTELVLGSSIDAGHVDIALLRGRLGFVAGPSFESRHTVCLAHPCASVQVGALAFLSDPLDSWEPPLPNVSLIALPTRILEAALHHPTLELVRVVPTLVGQLTDLDPDLDRTRADVWARSQVRATALLLQEFGWVDVVGSNRSLPILAVNELGMLGYLMITTTLTGRIPDAMHDAALAAGYLPARDGYLAPTDTPTGVHRN